MLILLFFILICAALWAAAGKFGQSEHKTPQGLAIAGKLLLIAFSGLVFASFLLSSQTDKRPVAVFAYLAILLALSALLLFSERIKNRYKKIPNMTGILAVITPIAVFFLVESVANKSLAQMQHLRMAQNVFYLAVLFFLFFCALPWKRFAIGSFWILGLIFGAMNHYLKLFRGNPLMPTDLLSVGTAFQVAGDYKFSVTGEVLTGVLLCLGCITLLCISPKASKITGKKLYIRAAVNIVIAVICLNYVLSTNIIAAYDVTTRLWNVQKAYNKYGSVLSFANLTQRLRVPEPEDYDPERTNELLDSYMPAEDDGGEVRPTVIGIMIEAFSDLRALGDFEIQEEYLENWYARTDYLYRGNCYVSVFGGNTANSEFEFLTGNSLGFLAGAQILPYQGYSMKNVGNLASILAQDGYLRTAFHPERKGNWNRQRVYDNFGFERFLGQNDVEDPAYIRNHISDACDFEKLIELYEENRGKQQFLFNVTMQNHGGYEIEEMEGQDLIRTKEEWESYTDLTTYLTLMRESDKAVEQLISYFENVDEPVILCIFGDHQPALNQAWRESVLGKAENDLSLQEMQKKYVTPYLIWANYDTGIEQQEMDLSANYLGALLLDAAGIQGSAYTNFLLDMRQYVPAINAFGYMTTDGNWHNIDEKTEVSEWIDKYRNIEYNAMFDYGRDSKYYR